MKTPETNTLALLENPKEIKRIKYRASRQDHGTRGNTFRWHDSDKKTLSEQRSIQESLADLSGRTPEKLELIANNILADEENRRIQDEIDAVENALEAEIDEDHPDHDTLGSHALHHAGQPALDNEFDTHIAKVRKQPVDPNRAYEGHGGDDEPIDESPFSRYGMSIRNRP